LAVILLLRLKASSLFFAIRANFISIALAMSYLGTAVLNAFSQTGIDRFAFLYYVHYNAPPINKNTAVKPLRHNKFAISFYIKADRPLP